MPKVMMYATRFCPYCIRAEGLLRSRGVVEIVKISVDLEPDQRVMMIKKTGRHTVPQIYIGKTHVGGYDDLAQLDQSGKLSELLVT